MGKLDRDSGVDWKGRNRARGKAKRGTGNDRNGDGEADGKSGGNFEMCKMYENFGDWMGTADGDSVSDRETDRSAGSYQEGSGGLT